MFLIHETFQETIQGEGYWTGSVCDFIRLYGCPVKCHFCDSSYSSGGSHIQYTRRTLEDLVSELKSSMVVISGGEPFVNKQLSLLVDELLVHNKRVHIETSGAFWQEIPPRVWVTVSPKEYVSPKYPVDERMWQRANEIKIVISDGSEVDFYKDKLSECSLIFLQPEWGNPNSLQLTLGLLRENPQYRLSLQTHKYIGVS
ncbi:7-carboxy-7-deazaguanine synthase [Chlorogloeopsis fritschii PCC 6912]|uniref:7-carboxy-7-deazaguanine synthase n=1 Tax=Chlorogloeopsis fritschii PCC 6912 TaxID=211165 RepID=A0A3S0XNX4_CHLFR|nr:7-carboxy-7-deazaguanine synthase QueE [Chlorogloeopsis fritschii]RUR77040.1 7-carboxy-7-deazaguanine synthase [Chlorogloeopsis fritschii PCC 6912]